MTTSTTTESSVTSAAGNPAPPSDGIDQTLTEIRSGRRLEKIATSISSFLRHQVDRLESELARCEAAAENDKILQRQRAIFENEKRAWEQLRQTEIERLNEASAKLVTGWEQLEIERRKWNESRGNPNA